MKEEYSLGNRIHGFKIHQIRPVPEQSGTLYEMQHEKNGTKVIWLRTAEENKLFSVAFPTIPEDDTGVFHIMEHSVLCGSKKYPVREPFLELMKSSMNTFLNAMTFPDKTVYPVSSRNQQDLLNLASVYLDGVFAPNIYENPNIFYQEGWHYSLENEDEMPEYQGVVYNEMKGAESSIDTLIQREMMKLLFPDTCYRYVSGGDSKEIPKLSYEHFLKRHKQFYHPSNAIIYLEGNLKLEVFLELVAEYMQAGDFQPEDFRDKQIPLQSPTEPAEYTCVYSIEEDEPEEERSHMVFSKILCSWDEKEKLYAGMLLGSFLADSMEAPLKKAILEQGLGQDVRVWFEDGIAQPCFFVWICNTDADKRKEIEHTIEAVIRQLVAEEIDRDALEAALNLMEFQFAEPSEPKGLSHNIMVLNAALYGGDPMTYLTYYDTFHFLREQLQTDYYEKLLQELFSENGRKTLFLCPSKTLRAQVRNEEWQKLANTKEAWSQEETQKIIEQNKKLMKWQTTPDTSEQFATIPKLSISDVSTVPEKIETLVTEVEGVSVLTHPSEVENIVYLNLYFAVEEKEIDRLSVLTYLPNLLGNLPTAESGVGELYQDIQRNLGNISFELVTTSKAGDLDHCGIFFLVRCSVLRTKIKEAVRLLKEILLKTDFSDEETLYFLMMQFLENTREDVLANGHLYALRHSRSGFSAEGMVREALDGFPANRYLQKLCQNFDAEKDFFINYVAQAQKEIFCRSGMTVSVTAQNADALPIQDFIMAFPIGNSKKQPLEFTGKLGANACISIPTEVSYTAMSTNLYELGDKFSGKWKVVSKILTLQSLWNYIRVQGGAYGTGMNVSENGNLSCYSYRDPNPENSLSCFTHLAEDIRDFCHSDEPIEPFLISTISDTEPVLSQQAKGEWADMDYFRGITYQRNCEIRQEILSLQKDDLLSCAEVLDGMGTCYRTCVLGPEN